MKILVTNDDGVYAEGIIMLCNALAKTHDVLAIAPDRERSATSSCLSMDIPLRKKRVTISDYDGIQAYSITGTPVDCVKLGLHLMQGDIDLVVSGINRGCNLGTDITYSGTVGAALDACMSGYPAIAFSQLLPRDGGGLPARTLFETSSKLAAQMVGGLDISGLHGYIYNINFPAKKWEDIKGIKACAQGIMQYSDFYSVQKDPFGREHYWLGGDLEDHEHNERYGTDVKWLGEGYITVSPLTWNLTKESAMEDTKCNIEKIKLQNG